MTKKNQTMPLGDLPLCIHCEAGKGSRVICTSQTGHEYADPVEQDDDLTADHAAETAAGMILQLLVGIENAKQRGLEETPARFWKALKEMTAGYHETPGEILSKTFDEHSDEMIFLQDIPFTSLCEHHLLPFSGKAHVAYIPGTKGKVVGLSKLARLVDCFARRLQMQERMTRQIAESLEECLKARGVMVVIKATHSCMACRGVKKAGAKMGTSCTLGLFREKPEVRAEFLALLGS